MKKNYLFFLVFLLFLIFGTASVAHALEMQYPQVPGLVAPSPNCTSECLGTYVAYWFGVLVYIAAALALISFTVGAVTLIISADNTGLESEGKERMKGAVLGLVLTIAAFMIIRTINPVLITPTLAPLPGVQGIYYWKNGEEKPVGQSVSDTAKEQSIKDGFTSIIYDCNGGNNHTGPGKGGEPTLLVWEFPLPGLESGNGNLNGVHVERVTCGKTLPIAGFRSFSMAFETPGIYYCLGGCGGGNLCSGYMSQAITTDQNSISAPFNGHIGGIRIVSAKDKYFGAIIHDTPDLSTGGVCTWPVIGTTADGICSPVNNINAAAVNVFTVNTTNNAGNGVNFYSEPTGWTSDGQNGSLTAGYYLVSKNEINSAVTNGYYRINMNNMCFGWNNVDVPEAYKFRCQDSMCGGSSTSNSQYDTCSDTACETFEDCPGSIQIKGSYLVGLYSQDAAGKFFCQTFTKTVPNLEVQNFVATGTYLSDRQQNAIFIIPIN